MASKKTTTPKSELESFDALMKDAKPGQKISCRCRGKHVLGTVQANGQKIVSVDGADPIPFGEHREQLEA